MRLLLHAYAFEAGRGSEPGNAWRLSQALAAAGVNVHVVTSQRGSTGPVRKYSAGPVSVHELPIPATRTDALTPGWLRIYAKYLQWLRSASDYTNESLPGWADMAQHLTWGSLQLGTGLSRQPAPYVFGPVGGGMATPRHLRRWFGPGWRSEMLRNAVVQRGVSSVATGRRSALRAEMVLVMNAETSALARRFGARTVRPMLQEGVESQTLVSSTPVPGPPVAIWVGRMLWRKAPGLALTAFHGALHDVPQARMVMIGGGPALEPSRQLAQELGLGGRVEFTGQIPWDEVQVLLRSARVHLFSSLRDQSGAQVLEAAAAGIPTIATTQTGSWRWIHPSAGWIADASNNERLVNQLTAHLVTAFTDDPAWQRKANESLVLARSETWENKADRLIDIYQEVLGDQ